MFHFIKWNEEGKFGFKIEGGGGGGVQAILN